jgi:tRNA pseudouridine38-40 synthase
MKRIACIVAYDGSAYEGWQSQLRMTSVQEQIEAVLEKIEGHRIPITASGRTDAGVNASGQVFMFDTERDMSAYKWKGALNGLLPRDIHIVQAEEKDGRFHARYNVKRKTYLYRIHTGEYDVFTRNIAYQCPQLLDIDAMREAAKELTGTHDFTSFNKNTLAEKPDQTRTIDAITIEADGPMITMAFTGKGFLRYQVRMMSAALIEAGKGNLTPGDIRSILTARSKTAFVKNAVPQGLTLYKVEYFEMYALNETGMIREFLPGDVLPEGMTLAETEQRIKAHAFPRWYVITGRHDQTTLGWLYVHQKDGIQADVIPYREGCEEVVKSLQDQIAQQLDRERKELSENG